MSSGRVDAARGAKQFPGLAITVPEEEPAAASVRPCEKNCLITGSNVKIFNVFVCIVNCQHTADPNSQTVRI